MAERTFLQDFQALQPQNQATGLIGFLQQLNNVGNALSNPAEAQKQQQQQNLMQTLAALPQANEFQGPERNAAAAFLQAGKIDDFQQMLGALERRKKGEKDTKLKADLTGALSGKNMSQLDSSDQQIVKAFIDSGDPQTAMNYFNSALTRVKTEENQRTTAASQALTERGQQLQNNKAVVSANDLIQSLMTQGVTAQDLRKIDPSDEDTFIKYKLTKLQAAQIASARERIEESTGGKVGSPGFFGSIQNAMASAGIGKPVPVLGNEDTYKALPTALVGKEDLEDQARVDQERLSINQRQEALRAQQAGRSYFSPKASRPKLNSQDMQALEWAKKNPKDPRAQEIRSRLGR